jgi:hypothetical protein
MANYLRKLLGSMFSFPTLSLVEIKCEHTGWDFKVLSDSLLLLPS